MATTFPTAQQLHTRMGVGWNLGNTLDAHPHGDRAHMGITTPLSTLETLWGNPVTTRENLQAIREAGFDTLRIPVTWYNKLTSWQTFGNEIIIRPDFMNRVEQVVNWALELGFITILNVHHDERLLLLHDHEVEQSLKNIVSLWEQIGIHFAHHSHDLIFEGMNEPRTIGSELEWNGGTPEERRNINRLTQAFVDTIRAQGSNNPNRVLMLSTYAAAVLPQVLDDFVVPSDPTHSHNMFIIGAHQYAPWEFAGSLGDNQRRHFDPTDPAHANSVTRGLDLLTNRFISQGIPVAMTETGVINRGDAYTPYRVAWTQFKRAQASQRGIPLVWWDNGRWDGTSLSEDDGDFFALLDRATNTWPFPELLSALVGQ